MAIEPFGCIDPIQSGQTITFAEHDRMTTVSSTALFDSVAERDGMLASGMESGAAESWDRLAELLERLR
jgi:hypothetical protein